VPHVHLCKTNNKYMNNTQSGKKATVVVKNHFEELRVDGWMTLK
jgi:hypothetical protein